MAIRSAGSRKCSNSFAPLASLQFLLQAKVEKLAYIDNQRDGAVSEYGRARDAGGIRELVAQRLDDDVFLAIAAANYLALVNIRPGLNEELSPFLGS